MNNSQKSAERRSDRKERNSQSEPKRSNVRGGSGPGSPREQE